MDNTLERTPVVSRRSLLQSVGLSGAVLLAGPGASALAGSSDQAITIKGVKVFDGRWLLEADTVIIEGSTIAAVGHVPHLGRSSRSRMKTLMPQLSSAMTAKAI